MISANRVATIAAHYDQFADRDADMTHWLDSFTYGVLSQMQGNYMVLEIGCGNGRAIPIFEQFRAKAANGAQNLSYTGIDCSKDSIEVARKIYPGYSFIHGDGFKVTEYFPEQRFDLVWFGAVLMIYSPEEARALLLETRKVLNTGAIGFISVPYGSGTYHPPTLPEDVEYHLYDYETIRQVLGDEFEIVAIRTSNHMLLIGFQVA